MTEPWTALAGLGAMALALTGALSLKNDNTQTGWISRSVEFASIGALVVAVAALVSVLVWGTSTSPLLGAAGLGFSIRLDIVSVTMLALVSFVGLFVLRYSRTYLDGEPGRNAFSAWIGLTLASVMLLVTAGNLLQLLLAWIATSLCLRQLLLFYPDRPGAERAARKHFIVARLADAGLAGAAVALYSAYGTGDIGAILAQAGTGETSPAIVAATVLLAFSAILMSAQFPSHGWLTEVMEAPTPVSALLHAGVINAGGFVLIRFADVLLLTPGLLAVLAAIGGFTALFGGLVMLTQPAVKTSLAWSTIAQMGFMIMQCGLALFPLALLHIVAHSLYKAHAFLASGTAVENITAIRKPGPVAVPNGWAVLSAFALALSIYVAIGFAFGFEGKSVQAIALGAILIFGVAYLIAQGLADAAPRALTIRTSAFAVVTAVSYFALHAAAGWFTAGALPPAPAPGPLEWAVIVLALASFGVVALAQATFPLWAYHPAASGLRVHLANGLYANTLFDRACGSWSRARTQA